MAKYLSDYSGSELDEAIGVVLDSGVSASELGVLDGVVHGSAVANRAVVLNGDKNIEGINKLSTSLFESNNVVLNNYSSKPDSPGSGNLKLYFKNGKLVYQNSSGQEVFVSSIAIKEQDFTDQNLVQINHNFGSQYPIYQVFDGNNKEIKGEVMYVDENNFSVEFANNQSGTVRLINI